MLVIYNYNADQILMCDCACVLFDVTAAPKPVFCHGVHEGPIITLQRSPFFKDVVLCIGGWTFSIWKEGVTVLTLAVTTISSVLVQFKSIISFYSAEALKFLMHCSVVITAVQTKQF